MSSTTSHPLNMTPSGEFDAADLAPVATETAPATSAECDYRPLTIGGAQAIEAIVDPRVRNLWITESYADLATRLGAHLGTDHSWCTFAVWASNTAGVSIRGQELPGFVDEILADAEHLRARSKDKAHRHTRTIRWMGLARIVEDLHIDRIAEQAIAVVAEHIAHGNTLVYSELAPIFVRFIDRLDQGLPDADGVEAMLKEVGVPPASVAPLVHNAFRYYTEAAMATDECDRAQLVLAANISAVLHEQQRLQHDVAAGMAAGVTVVEGLALKETHRLLPDRAVNWIVSRAVEGLAGVVNEIWDHIATSLLMTMEVPGETLRLSHDVPNLPDGERFPAALAEITRPELQELLDEWDRTDGTGHGSGASDWADLHSRMNYIVNLFRSRQQVASLSGSPFDAATIEAMRHLELPAELS
ncbi:MAG: hypothetical protein AAF567_09065 [Actinomycetota bacterium]